MESNPKRSLLEVLLRLYLGPPAAAEILEAPELKAETILVANLAVRTGRKIVWNAEVMEAKGCPEAYAFARRKYRKGW
jgi:hypothetical protein